MNLSERGKIIDNTAIITKMLKLVLIFICSSAMYRTRESYSFDSKIKLLKIDIYTFDRNLFV